MYLSEQLQEKWAPVLDHEGAGKISNPYKRAVTAVILENQERAMAEERGVLSESITNTAGVSGQSYAGFSGGAAAAGPVAGYDPILISLVRRALPNLIAYDIAGVQPMTGPTGLIFAMRSRRGTDRTANETFFDEVLTSFSSQNAAGGLAGTGSHVGNNPVANTANNNAYTTGKGMTTAQAEALGDSADNGFAEMNFSIEKVTVTARSRALKAEYTMELAQDLKAVHGLDAETELANILSTEILAEINREVVRTVYRSAVVGAQYGVTTAGTFDLDTDSNGRWSVEKFKGLVFQIERECNAIAKGTRRGKGNILIVSSDVASALAMAGVLDYTPALNVNLTVDDTGNTFAGTMHGRVKVYIDPYFGGSSAGDELVTVGYKGTSPYDAGLFYCPYVPLQMVRAIGQDTFQPKIGFKTRYGMVANPFAKGLNALSDLSDSITDTVRSNQYYRIFRVRNLT